MNYADFYQQSISDPQTFWASQACLIDWQTPFAEVLDNSNPPFCKWFVGGKTNLCHNAVDRWVAALGDQPALIAVTTETEDGCPRERIFTFRELHVEVQRAAAMMLSLGVGK